MLHRWLGELQSIKLNNIDREKLKLILNLSTAYYYQLTTLIQPDVFKIKRDKDGWILNDIIGDIEWAERVGY